MNREEVNAWRAAQLARSEFKVRRVSLDEAAEWSLANGRVVHETGGFFSVIGLRFRPVGAANGWSSQPFILQPEVGILGFLLDQRADCTHLLVQAKTEPGNPGVVQLAPTFQCTRSNYLCRHGGTRAPFFEFFEDPASGRVLADSDQSEQGTRFFDKYNRNVVVAAENGEIELGADVSAWRWITVRDISRLITEDFLFNTDARSVLATCCWELLCDSGLPFERWAKVPGFGQELQRSYQDAPNGSRMRVVLDWFARQRAACASESQILPVDQLEGWTFDPDGIEAGNGTGVAVRFYRVQALDREVPTWSQPMLTSGSPGLVPLIAQRRGGLLRFMVVVSDEPGFPEGGQISVPFQLHPGQAPEPAETRLKNLFPDSEILIDCRMSEEGGRFFHEWNRYLLIWIPDDVDPYEPAGSKWLTLGEISELKRIRGVFTNEFRSALSMLLHYL